MFKKGEWFTPSDLHHMWVGAAMVNVFFSGNKVILNSPRDSQNLGLEMVYQDLALAGNLPIGDNIFLLPLTISLLGFILFLTNSSI